MPSVLGGKASGLLRGARDETGVGMLSASTRRGRAGKKGLCAPRQCERRLGRKSFKLSILSRRDACRRTRRYGSPPSSRPSERPSESRPAAHRLHASHRGLGLELESKMVRNCAVNGSTELLDSPPRATAPATVAAGAREIPRGAKLLPRTLLAVPVATASLAFGLHLLVSQKELPLETRYYCDFPRRSFSAPACSPRQCSPWWTRPARVDAQPGPARGHHRALVPVEQRRRAPEVVDLGELRLELVERRGDVAHAETRSRNGAKSGRASRVNARTPSRASSESTKARAR